jgi:hypothetical protein
MEFNVNSWIDEAADSELAKKRAAKSMAGNLTVHQMSAGVAGCKGAQQSEIG